MSSLHLFGLPRHASGWLSQNRVANSNQRLVFSSGRLLIPPSINVECIARRKISSVIQPRNKKLQDVTPRLSAADYVYGTLNYDTLPVVYSSAKGAKVRDPEGKEYIDMSSVYCAVNQGHCHPKIVNSLIEQVQKVTLSLHPFYDSVFRPFTQHITKMFGYEMVVPFTTGSEAIDASTRLARKWAYTQKGVPDGKAIVFTVSRGFHGRTLCAISMSTSPINRIGFEPFLQGVGPTFADGSKTRTIKFGVIEDLERALELHGKHVAAFLVEPIQGVSGIVIPGDGYLAQVHDLCRKHNVLLICDEIQTGLCRTGKMLASDYDKIKPDMILLGKSLTGGVYPMSAILTSRDVVLCTPPSERGSTFGGNPVACAVAMAALDVLVEEKLANRALILGEMLRSGIKALNHPLIEDVRGKGLLNAVIIDESKSVRGRSTWQLCLLMMNRGLLALPTQGNIIRLCPPLVIEEEDLRKAIKMFGRCLLDLDELDDIPGDR